MEGLKSYVGKGEPSTPTVYPSIFNELDNSLGYLDRIENAVESVYKRLEPILPNLDDPREKADGVQGPDNASMLVKRLRLVNSRLHEIQYQLQQLPDYIQL